MPKAPLVLMKGTCGFPRVKTKVWKQGHSIACDRRKARAIRYWQPDKNRYYQLRFTSSSDIRAEVWDFCRTCRLRDNEYGGTMINCNDTHKKQYEGRIKLSFSNDPYNKEKNKYCICCPPYDPDIPHPHCYSRNIRFEDDKDLMDVASDFLHKSFELDGKRVRVTFEVIPD